MSNYSFCVDNNSKPGCQAAVLRGLKRLARYGRLAEKALRSIEESGSYSGRAYSVGCHAVLEVHRFPELLPVGRSMVPGWESLSVACGDAREGKHGGQAIRIVPVYLVGVGFHFDPVSGVRKIAHGLGKPHSKIGNARLKKSGEITLDPEWSGCVVRLRRSSGVSEKAARDALLFGNAVALCLSGIAHCRDDDRAPQQLLDLSREAGAWLVEDGIADRMARDIYDAAEIAKVVSA